MNTYKFLAICGKIISPDVAPTLSRSRKWWWTDGEEDGHLHRQIQTNTSTFESIQYCTEGSSKYRRILGTDTIYICLNVHRTLIY